MKDKKLIILGLVVFFLVLSLPVWLAIGTPATGPELVLPKDYKQCVADTDWMRKSHPSLLYDWRDEVVRNNKRTYRAEDGREFSMSLSNECLRCHEDRVKFCDQCHNYMGVNPACWDCHTTAEDRVKSQEGKS